MNKYIVLFLLLGITTEGETVEENKAKTTALATFGGGCYWCVEAVFQQVEGVVSVTSGFMGGKVKNPTYEQVCSGRTGHAEVVQVRYDPARVTYEQLLEWFWNSHDPTQLNRQGNDVGTQYRSVIFTHGDAQRQAAEASRAALDQSGSLARPVVTEISPASEFYSAEGYHQDYYRRNRAQPYCQLIIRPKLNKLGLKE
ncbi:MAG: peptide-methionine (S)-S-oxide reductase MsrA [Verrucomicrobia bacterium]|nr:peptide-methionine (S)-S-oxide reductase MsrA [Verrucomicrobiota bacterium]